MEVKSFHISQLFFNVCIIFSRVISWLEWPGICPGKEKKKNTLSKSSHYIGLQRVFSMTNKVILQDFQDFSFGFEVKVVFRLGIYMELMILLQMFKNWTSFVKILHAKNPCKELVQIHGLIEPYYTVHTLFFNFDKKKYYRH